MKHQVAGHFSEQWSWNWYFPYTNTYLSCPLCWVNCFCSCDISNRQIDIHFDLTANIHPRSIHTTCIFIFCSLWQSLKPPWTSVTHHLFLSTSCFCASAETPNATAHEYMQICEPLYASDMLLVQTVSFNGPFAIELHMFDVWLTVLVFGLCKLLLWQASQTAVRLSCSVNCWSSLSCPVDTVQTTSQSQLSNQAETPHCTVRQQLLIDEVPDFEFCWLS